MKLLKYVVLMIALVFPVTAHAVSVSVSSVIEITNAPVNSVWQIECGLSTGQYNSFTRQFRMNNGDSKVPVSAIFLSSGNYFCRSKFVQPYGESTYSAEINYTIALPSLSVPASTVIP